MNNESIYDLFDIEDLRDIFRWTSILDKDGNKLNIPVTRYLKDIEDDHLLAIIRHCGEDSDYSKVCKREINYRNNLKNINE